MGRAVRRRAERAVRIVQVQLGQLVHQALLDRRQKLMAYRRKRSDLRAGILPVLQWNNKKVFQTCGIVASDSILVRINGLGNLSGCLQRCFMGGAYAWIVLGDISGFVVQETGTTGTGL